MNNIRAALVAKIKIIQKANGYSMDIPDDHVFPVYDDKKIGDKSIASYPKVFVVADRGVRSNAMSGSFDQTLKYLVVFIHRINSKTATVEETCAVTEAFVEDLARMLRLNDTLGGVVQDASLELLSVDGGVTYPEGVAVCHISVDESGVQEV